VSSTELVEEQDGQHALAGPGLERKYTTASTGGPPTRAQLRFTGPNIDWDGPQLERQQRLTLIVDVVVTKVALEDKLDEDGYVTQTTRAHSALIESARLANDP